MRTTNRIGCVMISVLILSAVDRGLRTFTFILNKGNNKIIELQTILQRESQNS
jgi:hypothetical protein